MTHRQKNWTDRYAPKFGQLSLNNSPFHSQQSTFSSPSQQLLGTLLSLLPFTKYLPSIRHPNSCIVVWQQQICWLVLLPILSMLPIGCLWFTNTGVFVDLFLRRWHNRLCIMFSVIVDTDGQKRGPTSRPVVGTEIQRDCYFEAHIYHFSYLLVCISSRWFILSSQLPYNLLVQPYRCIILHSYLHRLIHKDFSNS